METMLSNGRRGRRHAVERGALAALVSLLALVPGPVWAGSDASYTLAAGDVHTSSAAADALDHGFLGIYADAAGTRTCAQIAPGSTATLYLVATLAGGTANGITGVEFRIQVTNPQGYYFQFQPPPNVTVQLGHPLDLTPEDPRDLVGANLAFAQCQTGSRVNLGTILVFNAGGGATELRIQRRNVSSNPDFVCPMFVDCVPPIPTSAGDGEDSVSFAKFCMRPCASDEVGSGIAGRLTINDPLCGEARPCPAACSEPPCVTLAATGTRVACPGEPATVTVTGTNCSQQVQDIDLFVEFEHAGHFDGVAPGQSVSATHTFAFPYCPGYPGTWIPSVGATARHAACAEPLGTETWLPTFCRACTPNRPPDCSGAHASVATLWPPNHQLVAVSVAGITDPDGDAVRTNIEFVATDEAPGTLGSRHCPDVFYDALDTVRLRAERAGTGDGRVYLISYKALDPNNGECAGRVFACVPKTPGGTCDTTVPILYMADVCGPAGRALEVGDPELHVATSPGGGVRVDFAIEVESAAGLEVFDVTGRRLLQRDLGRLAAGGHALYWDGRDAAGRLAASGIYIFRLHAGDDVRVSKGVLLR